MTLADLQDPLGLSVEELYGVSVDMGPADPDNPEAGRNMMTVGQLKDQLREAEGYRQRQERFDEEAAQFAIDRDSTINQLTGLVSELQQASGGRINANTLAELSRLDQANAQREEARLQTIMPGWKDPQTRVVETEQLARFFKDRYGLPAAFIRNVRHAGAIKAMRDFAIGSLKAEAATSGKGKPKATPKTRLGRPTPKARLRNQAGRSQTNLDTGGKVAAVVDVLRRSD